MKINSAEFIISAYAKKQFPFDSKKEVAFIGKSNVGKSSLMNLLMGRKNLVKTSSTPGKTQSVNFFNERAILHGRFTRYGYAKVPKADQAKWKELMDSYLNERPVLKGVVFIIDCRHDVAPHDKSTYQWLKNTGIPFIVTASKTDKLNKNAVNKQLGKIKSQLGLPQNPIGFSSLKKDGKNEIWKALEHWL